ncbi:unnamed protein product [Ceratitis capitata]|uniref:Serine/threonine-protein phosphatase n=1 Tax=Ceratitis capitata TaxID=7213 RepID=A0A811V204_CERCA|nr:unnamed protein product [Ceratitis capitata]
MLRSCVCLGRGAKRRSSSLEDTSSCRSSEIERVAKRMETMTGYTKPHQQPKRQPQQQQIATATAATVAIERQRRTHHNFQYIAVLPIENVVPHCVKRNVDEHVKSEKTERTSDVYFDESDFNEDGEYRSDKNYDGPHLKFPLIKKDVVTLIDVFRKKKSDRLLAKYGAAAFKLKRLPNLNQASTAISKQITVIGDLHGKLDDLLVIFYKNGLPSVENPYIFNGDFVDRGKKGLEVFLLLLACFLAFPGAVHLNRGNHEDSVMNARYGFIREVQQKYRKFTAGCLWAPSLQSCIDCTWRHIEHNGPGYDQEYRPWQGE